MQTRATALAVMALLALGSIELSAQSIELQKLTASPPAQGDYFGARVAISGGVALVGSPSAHFNLAAVTGGEAHVFRYDGATWTPEQILRASDADRAVSIGMSVAIDGNVAVLAGYENQACAELPLCVRGVAYVFRYDYTARTWVEEQKLIPAGATTVSLADWQEQLGPYVAIDGDVILLGLHFDASQGPNTGAAWVYRFDGREWVAEQKLTAPGAAAEDWFGLEVALSGEVAVVGAFADTVDLFLRPGVRSGSVHVFRYDGRRWNAEQTLVPFFDGRADDIFGTAVSVSGDVILVGSTLTDDRGTDSGSAYVFRYNEALGRWLQEQRLFASDATPGAELGRSVSINGGLALVAAYRDNTLGFRSGAVYVFRYVNRRWVQQEKLHASDELPADRFGRSVSLSGDTALICAYRKDDACPADPNCDSGAAYVFSIGRR